MPHTSSLESTLDRGFAFRLEREVGSSSRAGFGRASRVDARVNRRAHSSKPWRLWRNSRRSRS